MADETLSEIRYFASQLREKPARWLKVALREEIACVLEGYALDIEYKERLKIRIRGLKEQVRAYEDGVARTEATLKDRVTTLEHQLAQAQQEIKELQQETKKSLEQEREARRQSEVHTQQTIQELEQETEKSLHTQAQLAQLEAEFQVAKQGMEAQLETNLALILLEHDEVLEKEKQLIHTAYKRYDELVKKYERLQKGVVSLAEVFVMFLVDNPQTLWGFLFEHHRQLIRDEFGDDYERYREYVATLQPDDVLQRFGLRRMGQDDLSSSFTSLNLDAD